MRKQPCCNSDSMSQSRWKERRPSRLPVGNEEKTSTALTRRTLLKRIYPTFSTSLLPSTVTRCVTSQEISKTLSLATQKTAILEDIAFTRWKTDPDTRSHPLSTNKPGCPSQFHSQPKLAAHTYHT